MSTSHVYWTINIVAVSVKQVSSSEQLGSRFCVKTTAVWRSTRFLQTWQVCLSAAVIALTDNVGHVTGIFPTLYFTSGKNIITRATTADVQSCLSVCLSMLYKEKRLELSKPKSACTDPEVKRSKSKGYQVHLAWLRMWIWLTVFSSFICYSVVDKETFMCSVFVHIINLHNSVDGKIDHIIKFCSLLTFKHKHWWPQLIHADTGSNAVQRVILKSH